MVTNEQLRRLQRKMAEVLGWCMMGERPEKERRKRARRIKFPSTLWNVTHHCRRAMDGYRYIECRKRSTK